MKNLAIVTIAIFLLAGLSANAQHNDQEVHSEEAFVHPFLTHMGMPDQPREVSLRTTGYTMREDGQVQNDFGMHLEAGLAKNLGLHIRNDGIKNDGYTETMLQYAVLANEDFSNGISLLGELAVPTGPIKKNHYKVLFGASYRLTLENLIRLDGNVHYDLEEEVSHFENSVIWNANGKFFPVLEFRGHIGHEFEGYLLPAIKFRIKEHHAIGFGYQVAVTEHRDYDSQALITYGFAF
ncbi:MAG: hypothetical protein R6V32_11690 [Bacteroidales bacterium]